MPQAKTHSRTKLRRGKALFVAVEVQNKEQARLVELGLKDPALLVATATLGWLSTIRNKKQREAAHQWITSAFGGAKKKGRRAA